jgi:hypothetical protein
MSGLPTDPGLPPMPVRSPKHMVVYSPSKGIYLKDGKWSFEDPQAAKVASVFDNEHRAVTSMVIKARVPDAPDDAIGVEVFPKNPAEGATPEEVSSVGLPKWYQP